LDEGFNAFTLATGSVTPPAVTGGSLILTANRRIYTPAVTGLQFSDYPELQIEWFYKVNSFGIVHTLLSVGALGVPAGAGGGSSGDARQLNIAIGGVGDKYQVIFGNDVVGTSSADEELIVYTPPVGTYHHAAVCWDANGVRVYAEGNLIQTQDPSEYALDPDRYRFSPLAYTNQKIVVGASYAGGGDPGIYAAHCDGDLASMRIKPSVNYTGATYTVPSSMDFAFAGD
jgi:hypothetical protein